MLQYLLVLSSLCPELLVSRCFTSLPILLLCHGHPVSLSQPGSPRGTMKSWRLPQDTAIPAASVILSFAQRCSLSLSWGGSTNAPRFGDFSSLVAIGAYLDPGPCQKATEMFYGICWGFMSPPAHTLALLSSGSRQSGQGAGMWKGFNNLTTIPCPPMCPLPAAALREPDQHGSAGELRQ